MKNSDKQGAGRRSWQFSRFQSARLVNSIIRSDWQRQVIGEYVGIRLVDRNRKHDAQKLFRHRTQQALDLIRETDRRRFKRIQKHFRYIVNNSLDFGRAKYLDRLSACVVDFARMNFEQHPQAMLRIYAATLVHEATHGEIGRRGIPWTKASRLRIERLCHVEAARFMRHFSRELGDGWVDHAFKPKEYEWYWSLPLWRRALLAWRRRRGFEKSLKDRSA